MIHQMGDRESFGGVYSSTLSNLQDKAITGKNMFMNNPKAGKKKIFKNSMQQNEISRGLDYQSGINLGNLGHSKKSLQERESQGRVLKRVSRITSGNVWPHKSREHHLKMMKSVPAINVKMQQEVNRKTLEKQNSMQSESFKFPNSDFQGSF